MKTSDGLRKQIIGDCRRSMYVTSIFHIVNECFSGLLAVYTAKILGEFADDVFSLNVSLGFNNAVKLLLCIGVTVLVIPVIGLIGSVIMLRSSLVHDRMVCGRFLDKKYENVTQYDTGDIQYRIEWDPCNLRKCWVEITTKFCMIPIILCYLLYNAIQISAVYTLIVFAISLVKLAVPIGTAKLLAEYDKKIREYSTQVRAYETEITEKPHIVKLYGLSQPLINRLDKIYQCYFKDIFSKSVKYTTISNNISSFLDTFCIIIILFVGAIMVAGGTISAGSVAAMAGYFSVFNTILGNVDYIIRNIPVLNNLVERMIVLYDDQEKQSGSVVENILDITGDALSFSYEKKDVFENLSFNIHTGLKTAICGANGSGKSTLIKIFCGLLKEYKGSIRLNHCEMNSAEIESWRRQFAYAPQEPYLFSGSVKENVRLGNLKATEEEIAAVMRETGIDYLEDREVSMNQNDLSGGEKQKISIARALLKNTPFLFLDEPSNNLDSQTFAWLHDFIKKSTKTVVYISHDDNLSDIADTKIVL